MAAGGANAAFVEFATNTLSLDSGGLMGTTGNQQDWSAFSVKYTVYSDADSGLWQYEYVVSRTGSPGVSHSIFEVSDGFAEGEVDEDGNGDRSANVKDNSSTPYEVTTFNQGGSNPSMPGPIKGIKFDFGEDGEDSGSVTYTLISNKGPRYGDFYAKGGPSTAVWNTGFLVDDPNPIDPDKLVNDHIITPDTQVVPIPAAAWLFGSALLGMASLGFGARRRAV